MKRWLAVSQLVWIVDLLLAASPSRPLVAQEEGAGEAKGSAVNRTGKGYTAALVLEPNTRRVLFEENADEPLPTASMAKMMTCLIAMEEVRDGRLKLDAPVTISARVGDSRAAPPTSSSRPPTRTSCERLHGSPTTSRCPTSPTRWH